MDFNYKQVLTPINWHNTPLHKGWNFFKRDLPAFFKNVWLFRKSLWNFRWWDYSFTLDVIQTSLEIMSKDLEKNGIEIDSPRLKKVEKMRRAIQIIENRKGNAYIEMAEKELGELHVKPIEFKDSESHPGSYELVDNETKEESDHNRKVYKRSDEIEEEEWTELWEIFKGQNIKKYNPKKQEWNDWFDGTGMRGWWD